MTLAEEALTCWCLGTLLIDKEPGSRPPQKVMPLISIKSGSPLLTKAAYPSGVLVTFRCFLVFLLPLLCSLLGLVLGAVVASSSAPPFSPERGSSDAAGPSKQL